MLYLENFSRKINLYIDSIKKGRVWNGVIIFFFIGEVWNKLEDDPFSIQSSVGGILPPMYIRMQVWCGITRKQIYMSLNLRLPDRQFLIQYVRMGCKTVNPWNKSKFVKFQFAALAPDSHHAHIRRTSTRCASTTGSWNCTGVANMDDSTSIPCSLWRTSSWHLQVRAWISHFPIKLIVVVNSK